MVYTILANVNDATREGSVCKETKYRAWTELLQYCDGGERSVGGGADAHEEWRWRNEKHQNEVEKRDEENLNYKLKS